MEHPDPMSSLPVLWLTRWAPYPPLRGGDMVYSRHLLESLADLTPVHALAFRVDGVEPKPHPGVTWTLVDAVVPHRLLSLLSPLPNVSFRHEGPAYLEAAVTAARSARAVLVDFIGLFGFVQPLIARLEAEMGANRPPVFLIQHNHEHPIRRQMVVAERSPVMKAALALDTFKAGRLERASLLACDGVVSNTPADDDAFKTITAAPSVVVMPAYHGGKVAARVIGPDTPRRIVLLGAHEAHHKKMVLVRALDALSKAGVQNQAIIDVVGPGEKADLEARFPGFNFMGYVDDIDAYMATVRYGLIPDEIGGGFKHRALTHTFQRTPMLAVKHALAGMGFVPDQDYIETENVATAAKAAIPLLDDFDLLNRIQNTAFESCTAAFDWASRGHTLLDFIDATPARSNRRS
jgi:hypothetical protein